MTLFLLPISAHGQWNPEQYAELYNGCVNSCQSNARLTQSERAQCHAICRCVADRLQATFPDNSEYRRTFALLQQLPEQKAQIQMIVDKCNERFFDRPANRLEAVK
ncbi:MAG: hypothetical protein JO035_11110 [Betaproteobacteria bacterium]|nr:hypothetical protein [Betaproteobacteria bacterium]